MNLKSYLKLKNRPTKILQKIYERACGASDHDVTKISWLKGVEDDHVGGDDPSLCLSILMETIDQLELRACLLGGDVVRS